MKVKLVSSTEELARVSPVLLQLRPQYNESDLITQIKKQQQEGYQLAYVEDEISGENKVLCVAGFVIGEKLAWEKHIYVDDLVSNESHRSTGAGKCMIDWLKQFAVQQGCKQLHLDSGVVRYAAHKFYLREGFQINSHHFAIPDLHAN